MRTLEKGDILAFSAGLKPYENDNYEARIYLIGYFTVDKVVDFINMTNEEMDEAYKKYKNNAHSKRRTAYSGREGGEDTLLIVVGNKKKSKMLNKAIPLSQVGHDSSGRNLPVVSKKTQKILGIYGSFQRGIRRIDNESNVIKFRDFLYNAE